MRELRGELRVRSEGWEIVEATSGAAALAVMAAALVDAVVTDMQGRALTTVANPCGFFSAVPSIRDKMETLRANFESHSCYACGDLELRSPVRESLELAVGGVSEPVIDIEVEGLIGPPGEGATPGVGGAGFAATPERGPTPQGTGDKGVILGALEGSREDDRLDQHQPAPGSGGQ